MSAIRCNSFKSFRLANPVSSIQQDAIEWKLPGSIKSLHDLSLAEPKKNKLARQKTIYDQNN